MGLSFQRDLSAIYMVFLSVLVLARDGQLQTPVCKLPYHNLLLEPSDPDTRLPHVFQSPGGYIGAAVEGTRKGA